MTLMTKKRNRKMPDFKPREEWDQEHETRVAKLLGKKVASDDGSTPSPSPRMHVSFQGMMEYLRVAPRIPTSPMTALVAGIVAPVAPLPAPLSVTEVRIRRLIVVRYEGFYDEHGDPGRFGIRAVCQCIGRSLQEPFAFQCGFESCRAAIRWNPTGERDGHCPGCGSLIEAQLSLRKGGRLRMVAVIGNGDIPWL